MNKRQLVTPLMANGSVAWGADRHRTPRRLTNQPGPPTSAEPPTIKGQARTIRAPLAISAVGVDCATCGPERNLASEHLERRLTAILAADVAGYSRLTGLDEEGTHVHLREHLSSLVNPKIAEHRGRVVKNTGDGLLAEFGSAVDAVRCAIDVQQGMAKRNAEVAHEKRIEFRIGINIGDIIIDRGDIFGDGVNVAARLEAVADPGGVCISDDVFRQVQGRVATGFVDTGEHQLKNIARPVRIYQVISNEGTAKTASPLLHKQSIPAGRVPSPNGGLPSKDAGKATPPPGQRDGPARLFLAYAAIPILMLLLAHYLFVMKLDLNTAYIRAFSLVFPAIVGLTLFWQTGRGLTAAVLLGAAIGIISVFGMLAIVGFVDSTPITPSSRFEWQEAIEYAATIALATVAGSVFARALSAARNAIRRC
jgi:class 3 adenylate cyclase